MSLRGLSWIIGIGISFIMSFTFANQAEKRSEFLQACQEGNSSKVQELLKQGANINEQDNYGKTCLMMAIEFDHKVIENRLLKNKSLDLQVQDKSGVSALWLAAELDRRSLASKLIKMGARTDIKNIDNNENLLHVLARTGNTSLLAKIFLKNKENIKGLIDVQNTLGESPLMTAVVFRQREVLRQLVKNGASQEFKNKDGKTAEALAAGIKDQFALKILTNKK